MVVYQNR